MGAFDWLVGSSGGLDKKQMALLQQLLAEESGPVTGYESEALPGLPGKLGLKRSVAKRDPYGVDPRYTDYINRTVDPGFRRARQGINAEYANADAPVGIGGRTQALIGLAGEEAGVKGQMSMEEIQRRRQRYMQILQMYMTPKEPTQGLLGSAAPVAGYALGGGFSKPKPKPSTYPA